MNDPQRPEISEDDGYARALRAWRERSAVRNAVVSAAATPSAPRHARADDPPPPARIFSLAPIHLPPPTIDPRTEPMPRLSRDGVPVRDAVLVSERGQAAGASPANPGGPAAAVLTRPMIPRPRSAPALEDLGAAPVTRTADEPPPGPATPSEEAAAAAEPEDEPGDEAVPAGSGSGGPADPPGSIDPPAGQTEAPPPPPAEPGRKHKAKWPFWIELPVLVVIAFILTFLIQTFIARVYYVPSGSMEQTLHGSTSGGDRILAFKLVYDFRDPRQGEVVVFKGPDTWAPEADIPGPSTWLGAVGQSLGSVIGIAPPNEKDFVKRVIAVGGQTVQCCDSKGRVEVNGVALNEPYIYEPIDDQGWADGTVSCAPDKTDPTRYDSQRCFAPFTVPKGEIWVMGDHRSESSDSSWYCLGLTPEGVKQYQESRADHASCGRPIPVDDVIGKAVFIVMPPSRWGTIGSPDIMTSAAGVSAGALVNGSALPGTAPASVGVIGALGLWGLTRRARRGRGRKPR